jgi:transposase
LVRLRDHAAAVRRVMHGWRVTFDNHQAERDLRIAQVQQKMSGCFRSAEGAWAFCRVRSYISTLRKQEIPVLTALAQLFRGTVLMPSLQAE